MEAPQHRGGAPAGATAGAATAPQHRVRVLAAAERLAALLEILSAPSASPRTAVVFAGTKAGCDKLGAALGEAGWPSEVVHGNKRRDEQEASLRAFAAGECRCLVATEAAARRKRQARSALEPVLSRLGLGRWGALVHFRRFWLAP